MLTQKEKIEIDSLLKRGSLIPITANSDEVLLWCDALESGDYIQGRKRLRTGNLMCCLGVACDISGLGWWEPSSSGFGHSFISAPTDYDDEYTLPRPVSDWLGFRSGNPLIISQLDSYDTGVNLIHLNDRLGFSFAQIAYLLRKAVELGKKQAKNG